VDVGHDVGSVGVVERYEGIVVVVTGSSCMGYYATVRRYD
jgi:hypothetical protein